MNRVLRLLFAGKPKVGEVYKFDSYNPFSTKWTVKVIDVRSGWVLYKDGAYRKSLKLSQFNYCFEKEENYDNMESS